MSSVRDSDPLPGLAFNHSCGGGGGSSLAVKIFCILILLLSGSTDLIMMTTNAASTIEDYPDLESHSRSNRATGFPIINSDIRYSQLSRALEKMHFGPLLRLRSISNRVPPTKFASDLSKSRQKKSLSYLSRFYPVLQPSGSSYTSMRRRISFPHSTETVTFPVGRFSRPIMRLRWGK